MATTRALKRRSTQKAKRVAAEQAATKEANSQEAQMKDIIEASKKKHSTKPPAKAVSRKQRRDEARKAAEKQADEDARHIPEPVVVDRAPGRTLTLHELNQEAKATFNEHRDVARAAANAAGKAAFNVLSGKGGATETDVKIRERYRNMGKANAAMVRAAANAAKEGATS